MTCAAFLAPTSEGGTRGAGVVVPSGATRTANADTTGTAHAHADADALGVFAEALVAMRRWTFLLGPGLIPRINALFLGYVMCRLRLARVSSRPSAWSVHR